MTSVNSVGSYTSSGSWVRRSAPVYTTYAIAGTVPYRALTTMNVPLATAQKNHLNPKESAPNATLMALSTERVTMKTTCHTAQQNDPTTTCPTSSNLQHCLPTEKGLLLNIMCDGYNLCLHTLTFVQSAHSPCTVCLHRLITHAFLYGCIPGLRPQEPNPGQGGRPVLKGCGQAGKPLVVAMPYVRHHTALDGHF